MKNMIAAAAVAMLAASAPAIAETSTTAVPEKVSPSTSATTDSMGNYYTTTEKSDFMVSKLMGARVYATMATVDANTPVDKIGTEWDDIGEVNNIIIGKDGSVKAVVLGVGGFLSIGEKDVAVRMSELSFVKKAGDSADAFYIVVKSDKASLEKAPAWKMSSN
ncbi:MAG: PRC-barrel domain-containing protein [Hyphomicrobium sp.]|nr:PRC-barrel domain-containing protein [Hyphomicrobium sp.]